MDARASKARIVPTMRESVEAVTTAADRIRRRVLGLRSLHILPMVSHNASNGLGLAGQAALP